MEVISLSWLMLLVKSMSVWNFTSGSTFRCVEKDPSASSAPDFTLWSFCAIVRCSDWDACGKDWLYGLAWRWLITMILYMTIGSFQILWAFNDSTIELFLKSQGTISSSLVPSSLWHVSFPAPCLAKPRLWVVRRWCCQGIQGSGLSLRVADPSGFLPIPNTPKSCSGLPWFTMVYRHFPDTKLVQRHMEGIGMQFTCRYFHCFV